MGPEPHPPAQCANPPLVVGSARQWSFPPRCLPFFGARRGIHHPPLVVSPPFAAPHPQQGCRGWGWQHTGGCMGMETAARKTPLPHPQTNWCRGLDIS